MQGDATQAMSVYIVEERQRSRCPPAAAPRWAAARRPAGFVARSLHTTPGILVARASPAGLGACSKMPSYSCASPKTDVLLMRAGQDHYIRFSLEPGFPFYGLPSDAALVQREIALDRPARPCHRQNPPGWERPDRDPYATGSLHRHLRPPFRPAGLDPYRDGPHPRPWPTSGATSLLIQDIFQLNFQCSGPIIRTSPSCCSFPPDGDRYTLRCVHTVLRTDSIYFLGRRVV